MQAHKPVIGIGIGDTHKMPGVKYDTGHFDAPSRLE